MTNIRHTFLSNSKRYFFFVFAGFSLLGNECARMYNPPTLVVLTGEHPRASAQPTPALRLLPEILAVIFAFHAEANPTNPDGNGPEGMTPAQFRLGWITITHVCSHWRQVAFDHCTLWAHHRFNLGLEWTTEMLRRAGGAPLRLSLSKEVVPFPPSEDSAANVISQLLHRVSTLTIEEGACTQAVLDTLTFPAPLMGSLSISTSRFAVLPRTLFADIVPNFHHLFLVNALPTWTSVALTCLKSLSITMDRHTDMSSMPSYANLFSALQTMHSLESLFLIGCIPLGPFPAEWSKASIFRNFDSSFSVVMYKVFAMS
ncbi:hypothetical protein BJV77DRAFT_750707 [Russula vinacea]|nr:hypothetical protein BJV77DRAFT_750707 [Russula vinacea]